MITPPDSIVPPRMNVLGVGVHPINMDQALTAMDGWIGRREKRYVCLAPVHSILACQEDPDLRRIYNQSGLTTPDGMPLVWIARAQGYRQAGRVYGPELLLEACERFIGAGSKCSNARQSCESAYCSIINIARARGCSNLQ